MIFLPAVAATIAWLGAVANAADEEVKKAAPGDPLNVREEITKLEHEFAQSLTNNDVASVAKGLRDDWSFTSSRGEVLTKDGLVDMMKSGTLKFASYVLHDLKVRTYGTAAVVTGRSVSKGTHDNTSFSENDRFTDVFIREGDRWHCVATHTSTTE